MAPELEAHGSVLEILPRLGSRIHPWNDLCTLWALRRIVRRYEPHIVHTHTAKAGILGRLAARTVRPAPLCVHTFHGHVLDAYFGPIRSAVFKTLERRAARHTDAFVAVSPSVRDELVGQHHIGDAARFHIIPSGRLESCDRRGDSLRQELGLEGSTVAGWVGRLVPVKSVETFLQAIPLILEAMPRIKFLIAGDGALRADVEQALSRSPWRESVRFCGMRTDMDNVYATLDMIALSSKKEGLPTVLIEAALARVPIVATRIPGVTDLLADRTDALLYEPGSHKELAGALLRLASDERLRSSLADCALAKVREQVPDYATVAKAHATLYNALLMMQRNQEQAGHGKE